MRMPCLTPLTLSISGLNLPRHNAIIPYPKPLGSDGQLPLLSANADGIHATDDREGPKVLDSAFFNLGEHLSEFLCTTYGDMPCDSWWA